MFKPIKIEERVIDGERWFKFNSEFDRVRYYYGNIITVIAIIVLIILGGILFWYVFSNISLLKSSPCKLCEDMGYLIGKKIKI